MEISFLEASAYAGIAATAVLTINFLLGMLVSTNYRRSSFWLKTPLFIRKIKLVDVHNYTAYVALLLALLHPILLLFDKTAKFTWVNIIFPIDAPTQRIFLAMGTVSLLAVLVIVITTQKVIKKKIGFRAWKNIHLSAYPLALLFIVHGVVMDPQLKNRPIDLLDAEKILSEACFVVLAVSVFLRVRYLRKLKAGIKEFHSLKIKEIIRETADAKSFIFSIPENLKKQFAYTSGQFIIMKLTIAGKEYKRSYSMSSSPLEDKLQISVKRIKDGIVSNYLNDRLKKGDEILVFPPSGNFYKKPLQNVKTNYIFFAGGSGITPIYSIIKSQLNKYPNNNIKLIYANRNPEAIIFYKHLETLKKDFPERFLLTHIVSQVSAGWNGMIGLLDSGKIKLFLEEQQTFPTASAEYFICGPSPFMDLVGHELQRYDIPKKQLHLEKFISIGGDGHFVIIGDGASEINLKVSKVAALLDGKDNKVSCDKEVTILDAMLFAGVNAPYSCREGVCAMCMAKLTKGKVQMHNTQSLSETDLSENKILTCQATCLTKDVEISYDNL